MTSSLERASTAYARRAWGEARVAYRSAAEREALGIDDLERLATCCYLVGADDECIEGWTAAHRAALAAGEPARAAGSAFWVALTLLFRGQPAQANGWLSRADGIIEREGLDCVAAGFLLVPQVLGALGRGDTTMAEALARRALEVGQRFDDPDLLALATLSLGQTLIAAGNVAAGTARLDEVMVAVTAQDTGPLTSGLAYCAVLLECMQLYDLRRAAEWTAALTAWCNAQPDLVPYRGQCLVHRSQLQQASGDWSTAIATAAAARRRLSDPPHPALGLAHYQEAELHRLTGAFAEAERAYREAGRHGLPPSPGVALLELARGDASAAAATIRRALAEATAPMARPALLAAAVDVLGAVDDVDGARAAADELTAIAAGSPSPVLDAMAAHATGTVLLDEGDAAAALQALRAAAAAWRSLRLPYEAARTRVLIGAACAALDDPNGAELEWADAEATLAELGARPDLERLRASTKPRRPGRDPLSAREHEVLVLLAEGRTNREIADALTVSTSTAGRHVEHIFTKLGVTSRAAATAYAYEHGLL